MTRGNKVLWLLLFEVALVGGAAGAAVYVYRGREVLPAQAALAGCQKAGSALMTRAMLTDALIALYQGNPALAFERVTRAQLSAQAAGLKVDRDLDEVMMMLADPNRIKQTPQRIQEIADKLLQAPTGTPSPSKGQQGKAAPAPGAPGTPGTKTDAPAPAPAAPAKGDAPKGDAPAPAAPPAGQAAPPAAPQAGEAARAAAAPAAAPAAPAAPPQARGRAEQALEEGYRAILDAKTALIAGTGGEGVIGKLARARVMLDESGRGEAVGEELDAAIGALRRHDEPRARSEIEAALKKLR